MTNPPMFKMASIDKPIENSELELLRAKAESGNGNNIFRSATVLRLIATVENLLSRVNAETARAQSFETEAIEKQIELDDLKAKYEELQWLLKHTGFEVCDDGDGRGPYLYKRGICAYYPSQDEWQQRKAAK
jgi:hypothetical protein